MPDAQGKFQYLAQDGAVAQEGACRVHFDVQTLTVTPQTGAALAFDLGDLDAVTAANYEVRLPIYTGRIIVLRQLGKSYDNLAHDLTEAHRNRAVQCLLLEDMREIARFSASYELAGSVSASGPAEFRLYQSNLAVLPAAAQSFQWRLADIDEMHLDSAAYEVVLRCGDDRLKVTLLAKRTEEFADKLREAMTALATKTAQALHTMLPFLDPDQLQSCASLLREGRSAAVTKLAAIHKQIPAAFTAKAVDQDLRPYYDQLVARSASGLGYAGFKLIRPEDSTTAAASAEAGSAVPPQNESDAEDNAASDAPDADATGPQMLYWFLLPLAAKRGGSAPANVVAWEASSRTGRATYFFRLVEPTQTAQLSDPARAPALVDASIRRLNRVLAMVNFRRRPIYLSDEELAYDERFHRYAIAARRLPEVREVRASFLGRALHTSPEAWKAQVDAILSTSGGY